MGLVRLIYASKFKAETNKPSEVVDINETSKIYNKSMNITGIIVCGNNYFLQCLEGDIFAINKLLKTIFNDPRHKDMTITYYKQCDSREFDDWSMKLFLLTEENQTLINKYSAGEGFNPFDMSEQGCLQFLKELSKTT